jgi:uncharacterized protein (TIGR04255 family)
MSHKREGVVTYDAPPLVEVAMSIQYQRPRGLNLAHLGAFWMTQRQELPFVHVQQPIASVSDDYGAAGQWLPPSLQLALKTEPDGRIQMVSADEQWMCQLQLNRIVVNWRRRRAEYPRFDATQERFWNVWRSWREFLGCMNLERPQPQFWELTYVNRVPQGELWQEPKDWHQVFPGLCGGLYEAPGGSRLGGFLGQWVWESIDPPARLYVEPKPGRAADPPHRDELILSLTARGPIRAPASSSAAEDEREAERIEVGFAAGNNLIVTLFDSVTSDAAKVAWRRHVKAD